MSHGRVMPLLVAPLLLVALSSCSEGAPTPKPLATSSSTASPAPTPNASDRSAPSPRSVLTSPPALPDTARGTSLRASTAFGSYYLRVLNVAVHSGGTGTLRALSTKECATCKVLIDEIESIYAGSGHIEGGDWIAGAVLAARQVTDSSARIRMRVRIEKGSIFQASASPSDTPSHTGGTVEFYLRHGGRGWRVEHLVARA